MCTRVEIVHRHPFAVNRLRSVAGYLSAAPRFLVGIHSPEMRSLVQRVVYESRPDVIVAHSVVVASYALDLPLQVRPPRGLVLDVDNVLAGMARD
jgi:hypothetical protein